MKFQPKTNEEIAMEGLLEEGEYRAEVIEAKDETSKAGNGMIHLQLRVFLADGSRRIVHDYLLEAMSFKLKHFCEAAGLDAKYAAGELAADDCKGKECMVHLIVQKQAGYPPKNAVRDYMKHTTDNAKKTGDDLPF